MVIEREYRTQYIEHSYIEPEAVVAYRSPNDGIMTVHASELGLVVVGPGVVHLLPPEGHDPPVLFRADLVAQAEGMALGALQTASRTAPSPPAAPR